jgi:protein NRD1
MLASIEEYEKTLNDLSTIKAPGVSGSRIKNLKEFFMANVDEEDKLVSLLINSCKNIPVSNKLGVLYVIDAIVRALIEEIGSTSDVEISSQSPNGTAPAAVYKIQNSIEDLLNGAIPGSNDDVKEKIGKLIDIWISCSTFDRKLMDTIKEKHYKTFTPPGTPPRKAATAATSKLPTAPAAASAIATKPKDATSVLQALANLAKNTPSPNSNANNTKLVTPSVQNNNSFSPPSSSSANNTDAANSSNPNAIFQLLQNMNKMTNNNTGGAASVQAPGGASTNDDFRDRNDRGRMNNGFSDSRRDRSPGRPMANDSRPTPAEGERNDPSNPHYRMKKASLDPTIPQGCINVYSRTIFIGGVPSSMDQHQLVETFKPYAVVQSAIINSARRHAFVKVYSRAEAEQVLQAFSVSHPSGLRARWGVGFGPRDCCNYQTGISTIPLQRLTDADRKWIVNAEWGGTIPEIPLQSGLLIEEPDIEVGHGVSSKSISRKMPTNSSQNGPRSDRSRGNNGGGMGNMGGYNQGNPGNMPMNFGGNFMPPQQGGMMPFPPQSAPPYGANPYAQPPSSGGMMGSPNSMPVPFGANGGGMPPMPGMPGMPGMPAGMDQSQMMAAMMQAMQQMQGQGQGQGQAPQGTPGQPPVDMNSMMQVMANMMNNGQNPNGPKPPQ